MRFAVYVLIALIVITCATVPASKMDLAPKTDIVQDIDCF